MQNEKCYFSILYTLYKCTSYIFASQPASFNQVHQTLVQLAIMQGNPITMGEYDNQPNIWLHTNPAHTHTHTHTVVGTQERTYIVTLAHPHTCTSVHFITQSNRTFRNSLSWLYAVGELGFLTVVHSWFFSVNTIKLVIVSSSFYMYVCIYIFIYQTFWNKWTATTVPC